jgi:hypothetical protein
MFLTSLHHLQCLFPTCSIVNALFKSTLKLLFFKKIQNTKNKKKQNLQGTKYGKKEVEGPICFSGCLVTKFVWGPSN